MDRQTILRRQMAALQSRHDAGLTDKMIGHALGRDAGTIGNWRTGATELKVADMLALDALFSAMGDYLFVEHVCGELAARRRVRAQQLEREARELRGQAELFAGADDAAVKHAARG